MEEVGGPAPGFFGEEVVGEVVGVEDAEGVEACGDEGGDEADGGEDECAVVIGSADVGFGG